MSITMAALSLNILLSMLVLSTTSLANPDPAAAPVVTPPPSLAVRATDPDGREILGYTSVDGQCKKPYHMLKLAAAASPDERYMH